MSYKHLPRAEPRVLRKKATKPLPTNEGTQIPTSPKRSPPKTIQDIIQQSLNRKALGPQKLFSTFNSKSKLAQRAKQQNKNAKPQQRTKPSGKMSPKKKPKVDLSNVQFECDTSISLSSDTDLNEKTRSPDKPAAKRVDIKATPEQKSPEIRRSSRQRKNALATKLGDAIPIAKIAEAPEPCLVAHVELTTADADLQNQPAITPQGNQNSLPETIPSLSSSEQIMCTEIHMETATPENTRKENLGSTTTAMKTSSRYILDKPRTTEESFSKDFEEAMNILHPISPVRGISMTFQRERENTTEQTTSHTAIKLEKDTQQKIPVSLKRKVSISEVFT